MRTRIDTPDGDVTGPKLACLHHLDPPYPGAAMAALRGARLASMSAWAATRCPTSARSTGSSAFGGAESVTEIDRYPALQEEAELPPRGGRAGAAGARRLPRRPAARPRARRQRAAAAPARRPVGRAGAHRRRRCSLPGPGVGAALERGCDRAAARGGRAARPRRPRLRRVPDRQRVGRAVPRRRRRRRRSTAGTRATATGWPARAPTRPTARAADAEHLPGQPATAEAIFGGFVRRARAARTRAPR